MNMCGTFSEGLDYPVHLQQDAHGKFRVTYGLQVRDGLSYAAAAKELGGCIMHSLACAGNLDNEAD